MKPTLSYLVKAFDTFEETDMSHCVVPFSPERVDLMLARIQEARLRRAQGDDFLKLVFWDWGIDFRNEPDSYWEMEEEEHERHADFQLIETIREGSFGRLVLEGALVESDHPRTDGEQMMVYETGISWQADYKHGNGIIRTNSLPVGDLLLARLYYADEQDIDTRFAELARTAPDVAVEVIEDGIVVFGMESVRIERHLSAASLAVLLEGEDAALRQRAILALGSGRSETGRPRSRTR